MPRVVTFGEVMLRLTPPGNLRIPQTETLEMSFGGAEVNVAVALAQLGTEAAFVTRLPANEIARACLGRIRAAGVDVSGIQFGGDRIGTYFVERGGGARPAAVIYDRKHSAIATADPASFDWEMLLRGASLLHISGITPALSDSAARAARIAFATARTLGIPCSMDVNYRGKLWSESEAGEILRPFLDQLDWCICNENHARRLFGIDAEATDGAVAAELGDRHPNLSRIAITRRRTVDPDHDRWGATLWGRTGSLVSSRTHEIRMVDRVGGGDSFAAGLIHGLLGGWDDQRAVDFGAAALALKHTIPGDFACFRADEVEAFRNVHGGNAVQR